MLLLSAPLIKMYLLRSLRGYAAFLEVRVVFSPYTIYQALIYTREPIATAKKSV